MHSHISFLVTSSSLVVKSAKHFSRYYNGLYILFYTGLRISEFCGLTIQQPKTESDIRYIPMTEEIASCFRRIIANHAVPKTEPMVDRYVGFLFLDKDDMPMVALHREK